MKNLEKSKKIEGLALVLKSQKDQNLNLYLVKSEFVNYQTNEEQAFKQAYELIVTGVVELVYLPENIVLIVDECGLMKSGNPVIEFSLNDIEHMYAGNLIFVSIGEEELEPLSEIQIDFLINNLTFKKIVSKYVR